MKKSLLPVLLAVSVMPLMAQLQNPTYVAYIEEWKDVAVQQQADYGIPASITMAQALLESSAGRSELATEANNHFGIKCSSGWFGGVYYHDDDSKGECFRQYYDAAESFKDHSLFLQRPRYSTCFEIAIEDYEGWAYRLRECGYATDRLYASKLIKLIEDYHLDTLGREVAPGHYDPDAAYRSPERPAAEAVEAEPRDAVAVAAETKKTHVAEAATPSVSATEQQASPHDRARKATVVHGREPIKVIHSDPEPPYVQPLTAREERDSFFLMHPKLKYNGVYYVIAREGDTYANVAFRLNERERDLREDNDALGLDLKPGDRIYLGSKRTMGEADHAIIWVHPGESLWQISQRECVQIQAIQALNGLDPSVRVFRTRQKIYLRRVKESDGNR